LFQQTDWEIFDIFPLKNIHWILFHSLLESVLGIIMSEGPLWQHHRKFMTKTLKEMGVGKHSINSHINQEFLACCDHLSKLCSEVYKKFRLKTFPHLWNNIFLSMKNSLVKMDDFFDLPSLNVIWQLVCGKRFNYEDEKLKEVIKLVRLKFVVKLNKVRFNLEFCLRWNPLQWRKILDLWLGQVSWNTYHHFQRFILFSLCGKN